MTKYKNGPYHYLHYASGGSAYRSHVREIVEEIRRLSGAWVSAVDMGAGEGLVLDLLKHVFGEDREVFGFEADVHALALARALGNPVTGGDITVVKPDADLFLFLDVLEHVERWRDALRHAKSRADIVIVAIPDRHDRHAVNDLHSLEVVDEMGPMFRTDNGWIKNAREVVVFRRRP